MYPTIFIVGPTATGKTEVAYFLAKKIGAEIISCDSMLVYREPKIATAKPSIKILSRVKHHFIDIISVSQVYDAYQYCQKAATLIRDFNRRRRPLIVCGGTGLYLKAILDGIFQQSEKDENLREKLYCQVNEWGLKKMHQKLKEVDQLAATKISENDKKRIIRALEVYYLTGKPISEKKKEAEGILPQVPCRIFGLNLQRQALYEKINARTDWMFEEGVVEEVGELLKGKLSLTAAKIISVSEIESYLAGKIDLEEAKERIKKNTRNFAKRQLTWFRKDSRIEWVDIDSKSTKEIADELEVRLQG